MTHETGSDPKALAQLRREIVIRFNDSELHSLCFDLGLNYDCLPGQGLEDKARELVEYLERRSRISDLIDICRKERPRTSWPDLFPQSLSENIGRAFRPQSSEHLNEINEIKRIYEEINRLKELSNLVSDRLNFLWDNLNPPSTSVPSETQKSIFSDRIIGTPHCVFEEVSNNLVDRLNLAADRHLERMEFLQAQHCAEEALQLAERYEQRKKGCSLVWLAEVHRAQGHHRHAIETYLKAAESFEMQGNLRGRIITLSYIIELHRDHKEWEQVIEYCHKAMELAHQHEELSNGDGRFKEAQEYLDWQERFKQALEDVLKQYNATSQAARHNG